MSMSVTPGVATHWVFVHGCVVGTVEIIVSNLEFRESCWICACDRRVFSSLSVRGGSFEVRCDSLNFTPTVGVGRHVG
jgi:hypothetical protein